MSVPQDPGLSPTHRLCISHSLSRSLYVSHTYTHTRSRSLSPTQTHTLSLTHSLSPPPSPGIKHSRDACVPVPRDAPRLALSLAHCVALSLTHSLSLSHLVSLSQRDTQTLSPTNTHFASHTRTLPPPPGIKHSGHACVPVPRDPRLSLPHALFLSHIHTLCFSPTLFPPHTHTQHTHTLTHTHNTHTLTHTHTHTHTHRYQTQRAPPRTSPPRCSETSPSLRRSLPPQIIFFNGLALYHKSPNSGERQYKSRVNHT